MKYFKIICFVSFILFYACETTEQSEIVTIRLNPAFIVVDDSGNEPMKSKSSISAENSNPIYAIQIYEGENPIFYGLFDDVSKMEIPLSTTKTYKFKVAAYKKGTGLGLATDTINDSIYCYLPNKILLDNKFIKGNLLSGINLPSSIKLKGQNKDFSEVDAFYSTKSVTIDKGTNTIDFTLLRMGFGTLFTVDALISGDLFIMIGNDTIKLNNQINTATTTRQFLSSNSNFETIYNNSASYSDSIQFLVKWVGSNGTIIQSQSKFLFKRNFQKSINIDLNVNSNNLSIEDWLNEKANTIKLSIAFNNYKYPGINDCNSVISIDTTKWHSIALTVESKSSNVVKLYFDGELISSSYIYTGQSTPTNNVSWYRLYIGASYVTAFNDFYIGYFDELRISNKVRSPEEIKTVFSNQSEFLSDANTIGLWRFENEIKNLISQTVGTKTSTVNYVDGLHGKSLYLNGQNSYVDLKYDMPESNVSIEFWFKINGNYKNGNFSSILQPYGMYNGNISLGNE